MPPTRDLPTAHTRTVRQHPLRSVTPIALSPTSEARGGLWFIRNGKVRRKRMETKQRDLHVAAKSLAQLRWEPSTTPMFFFFFILLFPDMSFPPTNLDLGHADIDENVSDAILTLVVSHMGHAVRTTTQDRSNGPRSKSLDVTTGSSANGVEEMKNRPPPMNGWVIRQNICSDRFCLPHVIIIDSVIRPDTRARWSFLGTSSGAQQHAHPTKAEKRQSNYLVSIHENDRNWMIFGF
ncbi:hypothetical protein EV363DRAFT_1296350 [Boletus edulis]|nr:hypothetical protein EV363DRAFT_1296350 [Boletus edulis]